SFTTIFGGIETGPVGFSLAATTRRSCGRCAGVPGRVPGRAVVGCPGTPVRVAPGRLATPGRAVPIDALPLTALVAAGRACEPTCVGCCAGVPRSVGARFIAPDGLPPCCGDGPKSDLCAGEVVPPVRCVGRRGAGLSSPCLGCCVGVPIPLLR